MKDIVVFSGSAHQQLADEICRRLGTRLSPTKISRFSNDCLQVQLLVNVRVKTKAGWEENEAIRAAIAEGERVLGSEGRILVRPSGTEPLIRVMAEGSDQAQLEEVCGAIVEVVKREQGEA